MAVNPSPIPRRVALYLALVQLLFTLGWTVYALYLPRLAAQVGIPRTAVIFILMLDQAIFAVSDLAMGIAADKTSHIVGRVGRWAAAVTAVSCAAFLAMPFVSGLGVAVQPLFLGLIVLWAVTSSALRAPPLALLGKYAARPAIPWLASLVMLGYGLAGIVAPFLGTALSGQDPRLPFALAGVTLLLTALGLVAVERALARQAAERPEEDAEQPKPARIPGYLTGRPLLFVLAVLVLALGYQLHTSINSSPLFLRFAKPPDLPMLATAFSIGLTIAVLLAGPLAERRGGLAVMGGAALVGTGALLAAEIAGGLGVLVAAQVLAGAAWGFILTGALSAALAIGTNGSEGRTVGLMYSAFAVATFARMATVASGMRADPVYAALLQWAPTVCWLLAGAALVYLVRQRQGAAAGNR